MSGGTIGFHDIFRRNIIWLPFIIGMVLVVFELSFEAWNLNRQIATETATYVDTLKLRMKDHVESAAEAARTMSEILPDSLSDADRSTLMVTLLDHMASDQVGYIFAADYDGNTMIGPAKGKNVYDIEDMNGMKVVQELIKTAKSGGGYVEYVMPPIDGVVQAKKISYVAPFEPYQWYVGAGVFIDQIDNMKQEIIREAFVRVSLKVLFIFFPLTIAVLFLSWFNNRTYGAMKGQIDRLNEFLNISRYEHETLDLAPFSLREIREAANQTQLLVDERARHAEELERQAFFDLETGFPNRNGFMQELKRRMGDCDRLSPVQGAIVFVDIDNFKLTNDTFGHAYGDKVIKAVGDRLSGICPKAFVSRFGGDEYTLLLHPVKTREELEQKLNVLHSITCSPLVVEDRELQMSMSIGAAIFPESGVDPGDLLRKADLALYSAKENGRNRCEIFNPQLLEGNSRSYNLESQLKAAIQQDEFEMHYQPQIQAGTHTLLGFEALIRWKSPVLGLVMPNDFIPAAEQAGLISSITHLIIGKVAAFMRSLLEQGFGTLRISINVTVPDLLHPDFSDWLAEGFGEDAIPAKHLLLEMTESSLVSNYGIMSHKLEGLRNHGFLVALDDFGTGFSSLNYLVGLPFDFIKIDRSFINSMIENPKQMKMVAVILEIADSLGLGTVAEGVETEEQMRILEQMGANELQGYLFSRPLDEEAARALAKTSSGESADGLLL